MSSYFRKITHSISNGSGFIRIMGGTSHQLMFYTLSHLENDRDVSAWYRITRLLPLAQLLCFLTHSKRIDAQMMRVAAFILRRGR